MKNLKSYHFVITSMGSRIMASQRLHVQIWDLWTCSAPREGEIKAELAEFMTRKLSRML